MREIVFDTETTGFDPETGDRVVEIGCVELLNHLPTGETYHVYINPERDMPEAAFKVHGLSEEFLSDKPKFAEVADGFVAFIQNAKLIAHNANFDIKFLNWELKQVGKPLIPNEVVIDSLELARRKHPMGPNSLDALCSRYNIDNTKRTLHGALLDSEILAEVYLELIGGRQTSLILSEEDEEGFVQKDYPRAGPRPKTLPSRLSAEDIKAHEAFTATFKGDLLWDLYLEKDQEPTDE